MPQANLYQSNFTSGAIDPRVQSRLDITHYANGVEVADNVVVMPYGGLRRRGGLRPGLQPVAQRLHLAGDVRLRHRQAQQPVHPVVAPGAQRGDGVRFVAGRIGHQSDHEQRCGR